MRTVINERYETMFRWLAEQYLEKYSNLSNTFLYELYIKANNLKETVNNFRKLLKDMAEMIRDKDMVLRPMDNTICKFRKENGEVVFQGNQIIQPNNSHDSSLENQEPRAKKVRMDRAPPPVKSPLVEETPLDKLKNFNSPTRGFGLLKLFGLCLKDFDHLVPEAVHLMADTLKENLFLFSAANQDGILVKELVNDLQFTLNRHSFLKDGGRTKVVLQHQIGKWMQHPSHAAVSDFQSLICDSDSRQFRALINNRHRCFKQIAEYQRIGKNFMIECTPSSSTHATIALSEYDYRLSIMKTLFLHPST